jgi:hypothetical protein
LPRAGFAVGRPYSTASSRICASRSSIMLTLRGERPAASSSLRKMSTP